MVAQSMDVENSRTQFENQNEEYNRKKLDSIVPCDEVVFEADDIEQNSCLLESSFEVPFWFSNEDKVHIRQIFDLYSRFLKLAEKQRNRIREPKIFIGRIKRMKMGGDGFTTLDKVELFKRAWVSPGTSFPTESTQYLVTNWSEDGLPISFFSMKKSTYRTQIENQKTPTSYLFALPVFNSNVDFDFFVSKDDQQVTYAPTSPLLTSHRYWYDSFIPQQIKSLQMQSIRNQLL